MAESIFFYFFALVTVSAAVAVVNSRSPIYSALSLLVTMFGIAVLFLLMQATFLAVIHIVVYAGAIVVLFLFVIMLLGLKEREQVKLKPLYLLTALLSAVSLPIIFGKAVFSALAYAPSAPPIIEGSAQAVGRLVFGPYLLPFELLSLLILVAVIGAVYLGRNES